MPDAIETVIRYDTLYSNRFSSPVPVVHYPNGTRAQVLDCDVTEQISRDYGYGIGQMPLYISRPPALREGYFTILDPYTGGSRSVYAVEMRPGEFRIDPYRSGYDVERDLLDRYKAAISGVIYRVHVLQYWHDHTIAPTPTQLDLMVTAIRDVYYTTADRVGLDPDRTEVYAHLIPPRESLRAWIVQYTDRHRIRTPRTPWEVLYAYTAYSKEVRAIRDYLDRRGLKYRQIPNQELGQYTAVKLSASIAEIIVWGNGMCSIHRGNEWHVDIFAREVCGILDRWL